MSLTPSVSAGEAIRKDNLSRLRPLRRFGEGAFAYEFDLSADGSLLAITNSAGILIYDAKNGERLRLIQTKAGTESVAFSADGKSVAALYRLPKADTSSAPSSDDDPFQFYTRLGVWHIADGSPIFEKDLRGTDCGERYARQLSFSRDNQQITFVESLSVRNAGEWRNLCVYSAKDGRLIAAHDLRTAGFDERYFEAVHSREAQKSAISIRQEIIILNADSREENRITSDVHAMAMAFSPDGQSLAFTGYSDSDVDANKRLQIVSLADPQARYNLDGAQEMFVTMTWSPDGQWIAGGLSDGLVVWHTDGRAAFQVEPIIFKNDYGSETPGSVWDLAFSPDGDVLYGLISSLSAGLPGELRAWHLPDGKPLFLLSDRIASPAAFSPDSRLLITSGFGDGRVQVWIAYSGELVEEWNTAQGLVRQTLFSPDGLSILTAGQDGSLGVWEARTGKQIAKWAGHESDVLRIAIDPQGDLVASASRDGKILIREYPSGNPVQTFSLPPGWLPEVLSFASDGTRLLIGSLLSNEISGFRGQWSLWNSQTREIRPLEITMPIAAFSDRQGRDYAVWSEDGSKIFGELTDGKLSARIPLRSPKGTGALNGYAISPDGNLLASGNAFGLHLWALPQTEPVLLQQTGMGGYPYGKMDFSPDGSMLVISNGPLTLWGIAP